MDNDDTQQDHFKHLQQFSAEQLANTVIGIDRSVTRPVQFGETEINYTTEQLKKIKGHERNLRQLQ